MNFETMSKQRKFVLIAAAVGIIGIFLPWVSFLGFSINGFHGVGILIFLCLLACGAITLMGDQTKNLDKLFWMITLIAGGIAAFIMIINFFNAEGGMGFLSYGFYFALLGSLGVVLAAYLFRSPNDNIKEGFDSVKNEFGKRMNSSNNSSGTTNTNYNSDSNNDNTNPPL